jgi:hypothetical protein
VIEQDDQYRPVAHALERILRRPSIGWGRFVCFTVLGVRS